MSTGVLKVENMHQHDEVPNDVVLDPDEIVEAQEHPRMKMEREMVKNMAEITNYRPMDHAHARFSVENVSTGMVGRSKHARSTSLVGRTVGGSSTRGIFGQDGAFSDIIRDEERDMTVVIGIIADGHGTEGEFASKMSIDGMSGGLLTPSRLRYLTDLLVLGESEAVRKEICTCFEELDERVCQAVESGGSTLTVCMILHDHITGRVFAVTSNVGDSPLLLIRTSCGKAGEMATMHSWDSVQERRAHIEACRKSNRSVADVIYARWNTEKRRNVMDIHGQFFPIYMFKGATDEIEEINRDHVVKTLRAMGYHPGGIQSRVRKLQKVRRRGASPPSQWEDTVVEGTGHENYGSTPLEIDGVTGEMVGGPQMTRSMGERRYKCPEHDVVHLTPLITATPSVSILEFWSEDHHNIEGMQFAMVGFSDGPGDALYSSEFGEKTKQYFDMHKEMGDGNAQGLAQHLLTSVHQEGSFFFGTPRWDDLSMVCSVFTLKKI